MSAAGSYRPGDVVWVDLSPTHGREQHGRRPAVVISTADYLRTVRGLIIVVPVTTTDRGWSHHVQLGGNGLGLPQTSFAMTEQPRTVSTQRIKGVAGSIDKKTLTQIRGWISDFTVVEG